MDEVQKEHIKDFWYDLDNQTLFQRTDRFNAAFRKTYFEHGKGLDWPAEALRRSYQSGNHPDSFIAEMSIASEGFIELVAAQKEVIDEHLDDTTELQLAFEYFGQGILYDDRSPRPPSRHIHMMDGTPDSWVGWHRWYGCLRAFNLLSSEEDDYYLHWARCVALSWAIQTEADPSIDNPSNPGLPEKRLSVLREHWTDLFWESLDWAFATHRYRAPDIEKVSITPEKNQLSYKGVQQRLEEASGSNTHPHHSGVGRFWDRPYIEFINLTIYGHRLIESPGSDRGARSALVKVLRGNLSGMPQMPLNRPPMAERDIKYIERWIDAGLPK